MTRFNPRSRARERQVTTANDNADYKFQSTLPCEGATYSAKPYVAFYTTFQSTLPCEGATNVTLAIAPCDSFQSTLPCEGATGCWLQHNPVMVVSIHAPVRGSDNLTVTQCLAYGSFQSTLPCEGATPINQPSGGCKEFQSTLPCEGATIAVGHFRPSHRCFNPRSRARERPEVSPDAVVDVLFQSTLPCEGATRIVSGHGLPRGVSIHAPVRGSDDVVIDVNHVAVWFQSTLPCEGATEDTAALKLLASVSIHAPVRGSDSSL